MFESLLDLYKQFSLSWLNRTLYKLILAIPSGDFFKSHIYNTYKTNKNTEVNRDLIVLKF